MEISQALGDCVFHSFQECLCSALEKSCSKNCMEVGKSFSDEEEALPFLLGWETSKQHTCAKVQAPWERKARFNLWLLEESGGRLWCSGEARCTEDYGGSVQEILSARPHLLASLPQERLYEGNQWVHCMCGVGVGGWKS